MTEKVLSDVPSKIVVLSANCQGLRNRDKRTDVLTCHKERNASIVCLQDTHLLDSDMSSIRQIWPECYINGTRSNARGVITLLNNNFEHTVIDTYKDEEGNLLQLIIDLGSFKLNLINVYGPNRDSPNFFDRVLQLTQSANADYSIICGDFNLVLDPQIDCHNYININNPHARSKVIQMMQELNLCDAFRYHNPDLKRYSWRKKNPLKQARLDYFLISNSLIDITDSCNIKPSYRSDHSIIEMTISKGHFITGRGTWKLNTSLLKNKEYLQLVNKIIEEEKEKYAVPVYSIDYIKQNYNNICFTIDDDTFLEMIFLRLRGETLKFATFEKKKKLLQEQNLLRDIAYLESNTSTQLNSNLLDDKKLELENLRKEKIKGYITRARIQWLHEGEKPTSFFCKLENKHFTEKTIRKVQTSNGTVVTDQKKILKEVENYYHNLFKSRDYVIQSHNVKEEIIQAKLKHIPGIVLGNKISVTEIGAVLKKMQNNKSPGIDGIPAEFLKVFWGKLKFFVTNAINNCYSKGIRSTSMRQSIITCLPKGDKDRKFVKNWRPISLLTVVYKLASGTIAERLKPILNDIISKPQSGFIPGRCIGDCTRLIYDLMFHCEKNKIPGLLMQIDFEKAFDSVSWDFLYNVLESFGFDHEFINWIKLFNMDIKAYISQCGFLSDPIPVERGCRQGDPISSYLFLLVAEVLCCLLDKSDQITGISIGNFMLKLTQFADDTTIILDGTVDSLQAALNILEIFGELSGLKMNAEKTRLVWIGSEVTSKRMLKTSCNLKWGDSQFNLLGIHFSCNLSEMPNLNYENAIVKAKQIINSWRFRYLTPLGKITIIKTLILSKFTHLFMTIPTPEDVLNKINRLLTCYSASCGTASQTRSTEN